jgi:hypothetical protein
MTLAIITADARSGQGSSPSRIAASIARHRRRAKGGCDHTGHDQQDPNRLPRPMKRLPGPAGRAAATPEATSASAGPKPRKVRPLVRELELRFRTPFTPRPHLRFSRCREPSAVPLDGPHRTGLTPSGSGASIP